MSKFHYKHFQAWEKSKLERLIENKPTFEPIYGPTDKGWTIVQYKWLINISSLSISLHRHRETIKNELIRGGYQTLTNDINKPTNTFNYSKDASDHHHKHVVNGRRMQNTKILNCPKLCEFVKTNLHTQSLKGIAGRTKIVIKSNSVEVTISHTTLYNYINNPHIDFINWKSLKRERKQHYRLKWKGKRQNGVSINERKENINNRTEFGHWELDLIEGKRGTNINLLTMCERVSRKGIAMKINGKEAKTINQTFRNLQYKDSLIYGLNIKSITTDNGSEFWGWHEFSKSIWNSRDDIDVYFCNPYRSNEKGSIENFNKLMRIKFPKGTDFTNVSNEQLQNAVEWINNLFRSTLNYLTANEVYNQHVSS